MTTFEPLLTKLALPKIRQPLIKRTLLIERLNQEVIANYLTLLVAQAGAGKTTLLTEWANLPTAPKIVWLTLDKNDNDLVRFWGNIVVAFSLKFSELNEACHQLLELIRSPQLSSQAYSLNPIINELVNAIVKNIPAGVEICLVLDDYNNIENPQIHKAITSLLNYLPANLHLVLATRSEPNLPLARLRARRQLLELRVDDLSFSRQEATEFYNNLMQLNLSDKQITALEKRTEGWIAGMQLLALNLRSLTGSKLEEFVQTFEGTNRFIIDYLVQEVLENLEPEVQKFLLETSILERLTAGLCEAVLLPSVNAEPQEDVQVLLEKITAANLFLTPLDEQGNWFRYHQLFAAMLQNRLHRIYPQSKRRELHLRAAEWLEKNDWVDDAIKHYLAIEDYVAVAHLLTKSLSAWWQRGELVNVYALIETLPEEVRQNYLELELIRAIPFIIGSKVFELLKTLERVEQALSLDPEKGNQPEIQRQFNLLKGSVVLLSENWDEAISYLKASISGISVKNSLQNVPVWYTVPVLSLGWAYRFKGQFEQARLVYDDAINFCREHQLFYTSLAAIGYRTELEEESGRLLSAERIYRETIKTAETRLPASFRYYLNSAYLGLARVLYHQNKINEAEEWVGLILYGSEFEQNLPVITLTWLLQAEIALAQGDDTKALGLLNQLQSVANFARLASLTSNSQAVMADYHLRTGNVNEALKWAEQCLNADPDYIEHFPLHLRNATSLILNKVLVYVGKTEKALTDLPKLLAQMLANGQQAYALEIYLLLALALYPQTTAFDNLEKALTIAEPENYSRPFLDKGAPMLQLLESVPAILKSRPFIQQLIKDFKPETNRPAKAEKEGLNVSGKTLLQGHFDALSERELEVLHGLAEGLSNKALADKLVVSENTIKVHVRNIFAKLEVTSRTQALNRAKELGLF